MEYPQKTISSHTWVLGAYIYIHTYIQYILYYIYYTYANTCVCIYTGYIYNMYIYTSHKIYIYTDCKALTIPGMGRQMHFNPHRHFQP